MHSVLIVLRFLLGLLSCGLKTARTEWAPQPVAVSLAPVGSGIRQPNSLIVKWMNVRPVLEKFFGPPNRDDAVRVVGRGSGLRRPAGYRLGVTGPFPPALPVRSDSTVPRRGP